MIQQVKNTDTAFKHVRLFTTVLIVTTTMLCGLYIYYCIQKAGRNRKLLESKTPENIDEVIKTYRQRYERDLSGCLRSQSDVACSMTTGPANFLATRMQKHRKWTDNKYDQFRDWRPSTLKAIFKTAIPKNSELNDARHKLQQGKKMQEMMTSANKIIRKEGSDVNDKLKVLGLDEKVIQELLVP